jgi:hypothetical protein
MDANTPRDEDNLSDLERRLAGWQPTAESLDADAMLFAAGRAAGRRGWGPLLWPTLCALLAVQAVGLGVWGLSERAERQALASLLHDHAPSPVPSPAPEVPELAYAPSPDGYFNLRRQMEQDPNRWLASLQPAATPIPGPPPPEPPILRAGQRDGLLDP